MPSTAAALALLLLATGEPAPSVQGNWLTEDRKGIVRIAPCGAHMCGTIARVLDGDAARIGADRNNPDPRLRGRPIIGLRVLSGFSRSGRIWKGGQAYDPESGRFYRSTLALNPDGSLKVTGCVLFICQSKRWTKAR